VRLACALQRPCAMQTPLQITFRGMDHSDAVEALIRKRAEGLERFHDRITRCHVVVEMPHNRQHKGNTFRIRLDISTPTGEVVASNADATEPAHTDIHAVVRDIFDAARRQLDDGVRRHRAS
jgi:putative sigma-54 modulation protein